MESLKIVVLDAATLGNDIDLSVFADLGVVTVYQTTSPEECVPHLADANVCIVNKIKLSKEILSRTPSLELICVAATGYDNIDTEYCKSCGIAVCNVAGYSTGSVSQLTLAMVLSASVHLPTYRRTVADETYTVGGIQNILTPVYHELAGKVWGIVGYGGIGKKVGDVAKALGCRVIVCKRTPVDGEECVSLSELLKRSDIVTVHVPLTAETRGM
ncbi:MAG: hydroxyacid dehydrogenase, partial [Clostridia bacterium]|nr:hydroxyacid dehydrogenase [Clostridia bacterium]